MRELAADDEATGETASGDEDQDSPGQKRRRRGRRGGRRRKRATDVPAEGSEDIAAELPAEGTEDIAAELPAEGTEDIAAEQIESAEPPAIPLAATVPDVPATVPDVPATVPDVPATVPDVPVAVPVDRFAGAADRPEEGASITAFDPGFEADPSSPDRFAEAAFEDTPSVAPVDEPEAPAATAPAEPFRTPDSDLPPTVEYAEAVPQPIEPVGAAPADLFAPSAGTVPAATSLEAVSEPAEAAREAEPARSAADDPEPQPDNSEGAPIVLFAAADDTVAPTSVATAPEPTAPEPPEPIAVRARSKLIDNLEASKAADEDGDGPATVPDEEDVAPVAAEPGVRRSGWWRPRG